MVFNKVSILVLVALAVCSVKAQPGEITDWCPPCKRLITDFTPELKTTAIQEGYDRLCDDIFLEIPDTNKLCRDSYDYMYTAIREALNNGKTAEDICNGFGACGNPQSSQRVKFASDQKLRQHFKTQFSKLF